MSSDDPGMTDAARCLDCGYIASFCQCDEDEYDGPAQRRTDALERRQMRLELALEKIAAEKRPDGTYNLSREACEQIAKEALSWGR